MNESYEIMEFVCFGRMGLSGRIPDFCKINLTEDVRENKRNEMN